MTFSVKLLLAVIALGLWANAAASLWKPLLVRADSSYDALIYFKLQSMESDLSRIARGVCTNDKIC